MFNDIDFSLEFPYKEKQDTYRGSGSWELVMQGMKRCKENGIQISIACALMKSNADVVTDFYNLMKTFNTTLRINIIKIGDYLFERKQEYALDYDIFWRTFEKLFRTFKLVSCSEPILCAALDLKNKVKGSPCGQNTIRIQPDGSVLPCVYWSESYVNILDDDFDISKINECKSFKEITIVPSVCTSCKYVEICRGGCASRRILNGDIMSPDEFCPIVLNKEMPKLKANFTETAYDLVHSTYLCTVILEAGD